MSDEVRSDLPPRPPEEVAPPDPDARKAFESREDYRGYKMPRGMSLPQRRAYKKAIDEREDFASKAARQLPFVAGEAVESIKGFGRSAKELGKGIGEFAVDAALTVPRAKAAIASDPEGSAEFVKAVASGDRDAVRKFATGASESMVEPFATGGDAILALDAAERGDTETAALYGGLVLAPFALQTLGKSMSKGWLKNATAAGEEIPDEAAKKLEDLAKRVDEGKVTDDMQVRRELAQIEDDHAYDYQASLGERDTDFDFESVSRKPLGGGGESTGNVFLGQRQDSYTGRDKRLLDYLINNAGPEQADAIEYVEDLFKQGKLTKDEAMKEFDVIGKQIEFDDYVDPDAYPNFSRPETMYDRAKAGGGRSIDDIEGPSEAEIDQMVEASKFGDPEELEILKERMRRLAELEQQVQLEPGRVRGTRTPSVPGASSKVPEGTSRAERKGTPRERPEPKKN